MQRRKLGQLEVSAIGLGCATMTPFYGEPDPAAALATLELAAEIGVGFLDSSDAYGQGRNEELIARVLKGRRDKYVIATKFGNMGRNPDGSAAGEGRPEYVRLACERSLARLGTEIIDLYYIHRVDPRVPIEETVGAMGELVREGKVRFLGISEAGAETIRRAHAIHPLSAVQIEYSLWSRDVEHTILPLCQRLGIGFVAYSPLGRGFLTGAVATQDDLGANDARRHMPRFEPGNLAHNLDLVTELRRLAAAEGLHAGAAGDRLGIVARRLHRADPRDQPPAAARGECRRGRDYAFSGDVGGARRDIRAGRRRRPALSRGVCPDAGDLNARQRRRT